jgi:hypothetical protein
LLLRASGKGILVPSQSWKDISTSRENSSSASAYAEHIVIDRIEEERGKERCTSQLFITLMKCLRHTGFFKEKIGLFWFMV